MTRDAPRCRRGNSGGSPVAGGHGALPSVVPRRQGRHFGGVTRAASVRWRCRGLRDVGDPDGAVAWLPAWLGVAWSLFPDESHNGDGRHTIYSQQPGRWRALDPKLFNALGRWSRGANAAFTRCKARGFSRALNSPTKYCPLAAPLRTDAKTRCVIRARPGETGLIGPCLRRPGQRSRDGALQPWGRGSRKKYFRGGVARPCCRRPDGDRLPPPDPHEGWPSGRDTSLAAEAKGVRFPHGGRNSDDRIFTAGLFPTQCVGGDTREGLLQGRRYRDKVE